MIALENLRRVEIKVDGYWQPAQFIQIEVGDTFRMFESTGVLVESDRDASEFVAAERASIRVLYGDDGNVEMGGVQTFK